MTQRESTHYTVVGYILWLFGFIGAHRFYFGKPVTGTIWLFTGGLCGVGWLIDLFLIPSMDAQADWRYKAGPLDFTVAWLLHMFCIVGIFGVHRFYMGKWFTGILWLLTLGLLGVGCLYDFWTLNEQVSECNAKLA